MIWTLAGGSRFAASVSLAALLTACAVKPQPFTAEQLAQTAEEDRAEMFQGGEPLTAPLTVSEAIARALKYNLDRRSKSMEERLALGQTKVDRWDMLPKLAAEAGFTSRSEPYATRSRDIITQTTGADAHPTYSSDRDTYTTELGVWWNVLDFGLSYYSARQNADRVLIAAERKRKAVHNLVQEVRFAFWRAAAHQALKDEVAQAVADAQVALSRARTVERENLRAPSEALRYQKALLETLRQLTAIQQELSTAEIELAALINLPPGTPLVLEVPSDMKAPVWTMSLDRMEEVAFLGNPDLREQGYLERIAVDETRKAIVRLFPGITFSASRNYDSNSFLFDNLWYEAGARLSWNLVNLIAAPDTLAYAETNEEVIKARRLAVRMAVLAQVHISERQFRNAVSQYQQSDELWQVDRRLYDLSAARSDNDAQGMLERVASRASAIASQLRRFQTYAQVEQAYAKIQASLGQDFMPDSVAGYDLPTLSKVIAQRLERWNAGSIAVETVPVAAAGSERPSEDASPAGGGAGAGAVKGDGGWLDELGRLFATSGKQTSLAMPPPVPAEPLPVAGNLVAQAHASPSGAVPAAPIGQ